MERDRIQKDRERKTNKMTTFPIGIAQSKHKNKNIHDDDLLCIVLFSIFSTYSVVTRAPPPLPLLATIMRSFYRAHHSVLHIFYLSLFSLSLRNLFIDCEFRFWHCVSVSFMRVLRHFDFDWMLLKLNANVFTIQIVTQFIRVAYNNTRRWCQYTDAAEQSCNR